MLDLVRNSNAPIRVMRRKACSDIPKFKCRKVETKRKDDSRRTAEISRARARVDAFFDKVMVMVEDEQLRANRLALLQTLLREFSTIADFSEIVTEGKVLMATSYYSELLSSGRREQSKQIPHS